jgi:hypothetical protein
MYKFVPYILVVALLFLVIGCPEDTPPLTEAPPDVKLAVMEVIQAVGIVFADDNWGDTDPAPGIHVDYAGGDIAGTATVTITSYSVGGKYTMNGTIVIEYAALSDSLASCSFSGTVALSDGDVSEVSADFSLVMDTNTGPDPESLDGTITVDGIIYDIVAFKDIFEAMSGG